MKDLAPYAIDNPQSAKSAREIVKAQGLEAESAISFAADAIRQLVTIRNDENTHLEPISVKKDYQIFCNLIYEILRQIRNCKDKDIAKLSVQQMLIRDDIHMTSMKIVQF